MTASGGSSAQAPPTQPCNCKKSKCLKLYCECFASGNYCNNCNCNACSNNKHSEPARRQAVQATLERNPNAFKPKVQPDDAEARHSKGCHCKKSQCLKKYCECFQGKLCLFNHQHCFILVHSVERQQNQLSHLNVFSTFFD